jgi:hypothetical protein
MYLMQRRRALLGMVGRDDNGRLMPAQTLRSDLSVESIEALLAESFAHRLDVPTAEIDVDSYFDEFDLDPNEAPILVGKLAGRLGVELDRTALWSHPTIASLAQHIVDEVVARALREPAPEVRARAA